MKSYNSDLKRMDTISKILITCYEDLRKSSCSCGESEETNPNKVLANKQLFCSCDHLRLSIKSLKQALDNL